MANSDDSGGGSIFNPARIIQNLFVETDFESQAHTDMEGMIAAADPEKTQRLGEKLVAAASVIEDIGMELKGRKDKVDWEGEGADSFRTWVTQMSSATLRLAEMSKGAGDWMKTSAQTLREVKADMPKYSESSKATLDQYLGHNPGGLLTLGSRQPDSPSSSSVLAGPSQGQAYDASQKLADDHGEAVRQMRKLAQSYSMSSMAIGGTEAPTFPPMPKDLMPPKPKMQGRSADSMVLLERTAPRRPLPRPRRWRFHCVSGRRRTYTGDRPPSGYGNRRRRRSAGRSRARHWPCESGADGSNRPGQPRACSRCTPGCSCNQPGNGPSYWYGARNVQRQGDARKRAGPHARGAWTDRHWESASLRTHAG